MCFAEAGNLLSSGFCFHRYSNRTRLDGRCALVEEVLNGIQSRITIKASESGSLYRTIISVRSDGFLT